jgi:Subtilisin inhibitor-like
VKPLLTRAFVRNVLAAAGIAALCCGLTGFAASTAAASTAAPRIDANRGGISHPSGALPWPAAVDIMITVEQTTTSPVYQWTLTCDPAGGTLPDPVRACDRLRHVKLPPAMPPLHIMCPMIVYGPAFVTVEGWWHGSWISLRLDRTNAGCAAASWNELLIALGLAGPVNTGGPVTS